jgi:hypothetical protein
LIAVAPDSRVGRVETTGPAALATLVRRSRVYVAAATVVAVLATYWAAAHTGSALFFGLIAAPFVLAVAYPFLFHRLRWRSRHQPAAFVLRPAELAPARGVAAYGGALIVFGASVGGRLATLTTDYAALAGQLIGLALVAFFVGGSAIAVFRRAPLALRPDGLAVGKGLIGWDVLWHEGPWTPEPRDWALQIPVLPAAPGVRAETRGVSSQTWNRLRERGLDTNVNAILAADPSLRKPENPADGPAWITVDLRGVAVDRGFLVGAIRFYRDEPAARAGIGTEAGYASLLAAVGSAG